MSKRFPSFESLPDDSYIRAAQLVVDPKHPDVPAPLPFSACTLRRQVAAGKFPKPVRLSERVIAWRVSDVRKWLAARVSVRAC